MLLLTVRIDVLGFDLGMQTLDLGEQLLVLLGQQGRVVRRKKRCLVKIILTWIAEPAVACVDFGLSVAALDADTFWGNEIANSPLPQALPRPGLARIEPDPEDAGFGHEQPR